MYGRGLPADVSQYSSAEVPGSWIFRAVMLCHLPEVSAGRRRRPGLLQACRM
jgi:hypothetical protein